MYFISIATKSPMTETTNVISTKQMYLKKVYHCLADLRWY